MLDNFRVTLWKVTSCGYRSHNFSEVNAKLGEFQKIAKTNCKFNVHLLACKQKGNSEVPFRRIINREFQVLAKVTMSEGLLSLFHSTEKKK